MMKLLFLAKIESSVDELMPFYDFVPYKYGPFSYILQKDLNLANEGVLMNNKQNTFFSEEIEKELNRIYRKYGGYSKDKLLEYVYNTYPYFALRSKVKDQYLLQSTKLPKLQPSKTLLNTIHYEGCNIDAFINRLIFKKIDILVDVRKNPLSMKYGFRKNNLQRYAEAHGFSYLHIPKLGVERSQREELSTFEDYQKLFSIYKKTTLVNEGGELDKIIKLLSSGKRIALLCFEKDPRCCHRTCVANKLACRLHMPVCHL